MRLNLGSNGGQHGDSLKKIGDGLLGASYGTDGTGWLGVGGCGGCGWVVRGGRGSVSGQQWRLCRCQRPKRTKKMCFFVFLVKEPVSEMCVGL